MAGTSQPARPPFFHFSVSSIDSSFQLARSRQSSIIGGNPSVRPLALFLLLSACCVSAQTAPNALALPNGTTVPANTSANQVGPDDPVIILNEFCPDSPKAGTDCKTVITRAQFEKLTNAFDPQMQLSARLKMAYAYAKNLKMAAMAEQRGLDQTPAFAEEMRYARMQLLAQDLNRMLEQEAHQITDTELMDYYKNHQPDFEQAVMARIYIPHSPAVSATAPGGILKKSNEEAMLQLAIALHARAANGEDPDELQREAYAAAGYKEDNVNAKVEKMRRDMLPPTHEHVMDLRPGEVSDVISDPGGAHFIYKMISKTTLAFDEVKPGIREMLAKLKYQESMKNFLGNTGFIDAYFNPPSGHTTAAQSPHHLRRSPSHSTPPTEDDRKNIMDTPKQR
jgi:hypothetical protein